MNLPYGTPSDYAPRVRRADPLKAQQTGVSRMGSIRQQSMDRKVPPVAPQAPQSLQVPVKAFIRVRPFLEHEKQACIRDKDSFRSMVECTPEGEVFLLDPSYLSEPPTTGFKARKSYPPDSFDAVLWSFGHDPPKKWGDEIDHTFASQEDVFHRVNGSTCGKASMVQALFDGYNQCVVTYGVLNSGRTHTMVGTADDPGLLPRFLHEIDSIAERNVVRASEQCSTTVEVSAVRVWRESLEDLLTYSKADIQVRTDNGKAVVDGVTIASLAEDGVDAVLAKIYRTRRPSSRTDFTRDNRSSLVVTIAVTQTSVFGPEDVGGDEGEDVPEVRFTRRSTLTLVDLGGPGRAEGESALDGKIVSMAPQAINRVFQSLVAKERTVPYRESILTQVLQEQLGGNCSLTVVGCVGPWHKQTADTALTLEFCRKARSITTKVTVTEDKRLQQLRALNTEKLLMQERIHEESRAVRVVREALTERQTAINKLHSEAEKLQDDLKNKHRKKLEAEEDRGRLAVALSAVKGRKAAVIPKLDQEIRKFRRERSVSTEDNKRAAELNRLVEENVARRAQKVSQLKDTLDTLRSLGGDTVSDDLDGVPCSAYNDIEFDDEADAIHQAMNAQISRCSLRKQHSAVSAELMHTLAQAKRQAEDVDDALDTARHKLQHSRRKASKEFDERLGALIAQDGPLSALSKHRTCLYEEARFREEHTALVSEAKADPLLSPTTAMSVCRQLQQMEEVAKLLAREAEEREAIVQTYHFYIETLPTPRLFADAARKASQLCRLAKESKRRASSLSPPRSPTIDLTALKDCVEDYESQVVAAKGILELKKEALAYERSEASKRIERQEERTRHAESEEIRQRDLKRQEEENRKLREEIEALKAKEGGGKGCCAVQ